MQLVQGLTQQEVRARQQRGETNAASFRSSRSYWDIIRANLFNFFNNILFAIGIARPDLLRRLLRFVLPAAIVTTIFGVGIYTFFYTIIEQGVQTTAIPPDAVARWEAYAGLTYQADAGFGAAAATIVAQTALSTFVSLAAFGLILFLEPPFRFFTGWAPVSPDKRPALLALALAIIYVIVLVTPIPANYFGLVTPGVRGPENMVMLVTLPLWFLSLRTIWRAKLFDRLLTVGERS